MPTPTPERFTVEFPDAAVDDLCDRLRRTRWPLDPGNADWTYGTSLEYLREFVRYWSEEYDWRAAEAAINRFDHYRVELDGVPVHFVWRRSAQPGALPLICTHGWPWTFWDLHRMIEPLADPAAHDGDPSDAFDVVVPSLPGFGFSSPLTRTGIGAGATARLWRRLMTEVLGYPRFGAQGGDFGAIVTQAMAQQSGTDLIGVHLNRYKRLASVGQAMGTGVVTADDYGPGEEGEYERQLAGQPLGVSHLTVNTHDPQSLAYGMNDSPVGLAGWLLERRRAWSDCDGDLEQAFDREFLATTLTLYWLTETFPTSLRMYWETAHEPPPPIGIGRDGLVIDAPLAIGVLPRDVIVMPRSHAEQDTNLQRWTRYERGGHFGPAEVPELIVDDLRSFFRPLRNAD
ncbi:MAG: epoxide hydrolase family protein [Sciscionella sp.]